MDAFSMTYDVHWADIDSNRHMRYSAYIDAAAELRYRFFAQHDIPLETFDRLGISPVYTSLTVNFFREVRLGETISITFQLSGLSEQGLRWKFWHDFLKANGKKAVSLSLEGTFINLDTRQPTVLPPEILSVFQLAPHAPQFELLSETRWFR